MTDPLRKPRRLRFRLSRALLVSAPLIGGLACGSAEPEVNTVGPEPVHTNVVDGEEEPPPPEEEPEPEPRPDINTNVVEPRPDDNTNVVEEADPPPE